MNLKNAFFVAALAALSTQAHAGEVRTSGVDARRLHIALLDAGADMRIGGDPSYVEEQVRTYNLMCTLHSGDSYDPPQANTYDCEFDINGGNRTRSVDGYQAQDLFEALEQNKLVADCGMGKCGLPVQQIECNRYTSTYSRTTDWNCTLRADSSHIAE